MVAAVHELCRHYRAGKVTHTLAVVDAKLYILSSHEDKAMLKSVGFRQVELFYAGLAFRSWVAYIKDDDDDNAATDAVATTKEEN
jgi:hypothetical protein